MAVGRCKIIRSSSTVGIICAGFPAEALSADLALIPCLVMSPAADSILYSMSNQPTPEKEKAKELDLADDEIRWKADPWHASAPPSPLRAGSSCIRVCKYPDAHASRRRIEHELSRA